MRTQRIGLNAFPLSMVVSSLSDSSDESSQSWQYPLNQLNRTINVFAEMQSRIPGGVVFIRIYSLRTERFLPSRRTGVVPYRTLRIWSTKSCVRASVLDLSSSRKFPSGLRTESLIVINIHCLPKFLPVFFVIESIPMTSYNRQTNKNRKIQKPAEAVVSRIVLFPLANLLDISTVVVYSLSSYSTYQITLHGWSTTVLSQYKHLLLLK